MTLNELTKKVIRSENRKRVPSPKEIWKSKTSVVASEKIGEDIEITVYHNGYIIYRNGEDTTVFPLHSCRDYEEKDVCGNTNVIPFEVFAEQPWHIRAFLEGENRLVHNGNNSRSYNEKLSIDVSHFNENTYNVLDSDEGASDPLLLLLEQEDEIRKDQEICKLNFAMEKLTEKQRFVMTRCVVEGKTHAEVASELGTTRANVSDTLRKALKKLRKIYGISDRKFMTNHFSRW